jgi:hypothetical protein
MTASYSAVLNAVRDVPDAALRTHLVEALYALAIADDERNEASAILDVFSGHTLVDMAKNALEVSESFERTRTSLTACYARLATWLPARRGAR